MREIKKIWRDSFRYFFIKYVFLKTKKTRVWGCSPTSDFSYFSQSGKCEKSVSVYTLALLAIP